jgi:hypothetical protein
MMDYDLTLLSSKSRSRETTSGALYLLFRSIALCPLNLPSGSCTRWVRGKIPRYSFPKKLLEDIEQACY